jgi:hypothetical protein
MGRSRSAAAPGRAKSAGPGKKTRNARSKTTGRHDVVQVVHASLAAAAAKGRVATPLCLSQVDAASAPAAVKVAAVKPEAVKPEAVKPEAVKPEAVKPEAVKPEAVKPEAVKPEAVKAEGPSTLRSVRPAAPVAEVAPVEVAPARVPTVRPAGPSTRLATIPMAPLPPQRLPTVPMAPLAPPVVTAEDDETPRSIPAVVLSDDDEPAPSSQPDPQSFLPLPRSRARRLLRRTPHLAHHVATRKRFWVTLVAAALVGLIIRERGDVVRLLSRIPMPKSFAGAPAKPAPQPAPAPVVEPPACPPEMALVVRDEIRVCVDKWEASLVEVVAGEDVPWSPYVAIDGLVSTPATPNASGRTFKAVSKAGVVPQGYIDRDTAQVACETAGKRLCQAAEWMAACEGPRRTTYPYGNDPDEKACNTHGRSPLGELFGATFKDHLYDNKVMNDPSLNALEGTVAKTGAFDKCTNGFGVYDMVGNLHEWTAEKKGVFHGGYYQDATLNGPGCRYATSAHFSSYHDYSTGFRCCKDAE